MYEKMMAAKREKEAAAAAAAAPVAAAGSSAAPAAAAAAAAPKLSLPVVTPPTNGKLVLFGATNYADMGKKVGNQIDADDTPNLAGPHRLLAGLGKVKIVSVATGCTSAHVVALGAGGEVFAWGRNDAGQLGLGDQTLRATPTRVAALAGKGVTAASTGKAHTLFVAKGGELYACGSCKHGACGPEKKRADHIAKPVVVPFGGALIRFSACGPNWNLAIDSEGDVWSWGWSEFGVLGNGTDHQHNTKDGSVKLSYEARATPEKVRKLVGERCVHVACGAQHCAAVSESGVCYTWGNGGYGRLGHKDQTDLHTPKPFEEVRAQSVTCGHAHTAFLGWPLLRNGAVCMNGPPSFFMCGRVKVRAHACLPERRPRPNAPRPEAPPESPTPSDCAPRWPVCSARRSRRRKTRGCIRRRRTSFVGGM